MNESVLIISYTGDLHADYVVGALRRKRANYFRFNIDQYPRLVKCSATLSDYNTLELRIEKNNRTIVSDEIKSIIYFPSAMVRENRYDLSEFKNDFVKKFITQESDCVLTMLFGALQNKFWINPPENVSKAMNKLQQLVLAKRLGLSVPNTLIVNSPERARQFVGSNFPKATALKATRGISFRKNGQKHSLGIPVRKILESDISNHNAPMFLQEYIEKAFELRITIVGNSIFACEIHSQSSKNPLTRSDWRVHDFTNVPYKIHDLPKDIADKCLSMNKFLTLHYSAIDMIFTPEGKYVFLEVNSHGLWQWIEVITGLPISEAIADLLIEGRKLNDRQFI